MILKKGTKKKSLAPAPSVDVDLIEGHIRDILKFIHEDPTREGLIDTPKRHARSLQFLTSGYQATVEEVVGKALFHSESSELVIVKDVELYSLCEHHLLPFYGKAHVAYIPNKKIIGLSKIPRIVDVFARRLQVQERLTAQVADALVKVLNPLGVAVVIEASHFCMMMRGVEKQNSQTITSAMRGEFYTDPMTRAEFLNLLKIR
jgi:GTP cyclohydrolase I